MPGSSGKVTLVPKTKKVPYVFGVDAQREVARNAAIVDEFIRKYQENKNKSADQSIDYNSVKNFKPFENY